MRFAGHGARLAAICPEDSFLTHAPAVAERYRFHVTAPLRSLRHAIAAGRADYLVPADDASVALLHELAATRPSLQPLFEQSLGSAAAYPLVQSRSGLLSLARTLGISVPETEQINSAGELQRWCSDHGNGFVLKKDGTWGGRGVCMVGSRAGAHAAFEQLQRRVRVGARAAQWLRIGDGSAFARLPSLPRPEITAQALVRGTPANSMYACHKGRILGEVQARVAASKGKTGPSLIVELIRDPRITRAGELLAQALGLSGFFGLDFILDSETGEPFLIEMNPRSTQLGHVAVAGQADLAGLLWSEWAGIAPPQAADPELGPAMWFYPDGEQWTQATASFPGCRPDVQPEEQAAVDALLQKAAASSGSPRRRLWTLFARHKRALAQEAPTEPFFYGDFAEWRGSAGPKDAQPHLLQRSVPLAG